MVKNIKYYILAKSKIKISTKYPALREIGIITQLPGQCSFTTTSPPAYQQPLPPPQQIIIMMMKRVIEP